MWNEWRAAIQRAYPRRGDHWSVSEDRKLRRLVRKHVIEAQAKATWRLSLNQKWLPVARALRRNTGGCIARWQILKVVDAHRRAEASK